ncbi:MAG: hypothetical protein ABI977_22095 [Acidobacteriota bacterium]
MKHWIHDHKNVFSVAALALVCLCLIGLSSMLSNNEHYSADAQTTAGWNSRHYNQVPADTLTGISGSEMLGYGFKFNGLTWDRDRVPNVIKPVALTAATAETTVWTPTSGKKFRLMGMVLTASAATTLTFKDNTAGTTIFTLRLGADSPTSITPAMLGNGVLSAAANNLLTVTRGTSATLDGWILGQEN